MYINDNKINASVRTVSDLNNVVAADELFKNSIL